MTMPDEMLRLVRAPDGSIVPDITGKLPGPELWIACSREALAQSEALIHQTFGADTALPAHADAMIESALVRHLISKLSLARKAGGVVCGFAKVQAALQQGEAQMLMEASDAGVADGQKLRHKAHVQKIPVMALLTRSELGKPFGRAETVHAALRDKAFYAEILKETRRLAGFRKQDVL